jgi:hypothetical protein
VCTADSSALAARTEQLERMHRNLDRIERTEHGVLLYFPNRPAIEADVCRFAVDEKACCTFWGFEVATTDDDIILHWDAPPTLDHHMDTVPAHLDSDEPVTASSGLL